MLIKLIIDLGIRVVHYFFNCVRNITNSTKFELHEETFIY
jgi:hypothetical protein